MCNQRNPADDADRSGRSPNGARRWGVFLWFLSLHEQRKEPARPKDEWKPLLLSAKTIKSKNWIPAFAGMTSEKKARDSRQKYAETTNIDL